LLVDDEPALTNLVKMALHPDVALQNANSGFANADAFDFLSLSTAFYCPQYQ